MAIAMTEQELSKGFFISVEGLDGSGKSTLAHNLYQRLVAQGYPVMITREPGGTEMGYFIRNLLHADVGNAQAEFLLFAADRALHMQQFVIPYVNAGYIVISDRSADSSCAYQGYGRGLNVDTINEVNAWVMQGHYPDVVVYLDMPPEQVQTRIRQRGNEATSFEKEQLPFFQRVHRGFDAIFAQREAVVRIQAMQSEEVVAQQAVTGVVPYIHG